jgi:acyl carrier protein
VSKNLIENIYPLSPVQQGMLFHTLLAPRAGVYLQQRSCTLHGTLNVTEFKEAWQRVVERHAVLRTGFNWEQREEPFQVVYRQVTLPWEEHDWRGLKPAEQSEQMERLLAQDRERGFELSRAPLMRLVLIHVAEDIHQFIWSNHHLLLDGWSLTLVLNEVLTSYEALCRGESPNFNGRRHYADYIAWLSRQDITRAEAFWRQTLKGFTTPTPLGVDCVPSDSARPYDFREMHISAEAMSTLRRVARQHRMTMNAFVRGAWALVLSRYSGESDVVFGATVSGRSAALDDIESMVGLFINTVPVRIKVASDEALIPWLKRLQSEQFEAQQFEHISLTQLQAWSEVPRGLPLFESNVVFENAPFDANLLERKEGLRVEDHRYVEQAHYPLSLVVMPGRRMFVRIIYDRRRFDAATIDRMLDHLKVFLTRMAEQSEIRIAGMPLLGTSERHQLLSDFNKTEMDYASEKRLHELFEEQVAGTPEATVLSSPAATKSESDVPFVAPRTSVEEITVRIWSEVLGIERIGVHDNFFDLGGHSLFAISLLSRVRNEFQIELQLRSIVDAPTPAELAMVIIQHLAEEIDDLQVKQILQELESAEAHQIS